MQSFHSSAPTPDLRVVKTDDLHAHEEHDSQRSAPLMAALRNADVLINPPVVTPMEHGGYMLLDGANRGFAFAGLGYPHILVQVASYNSGYVDLDVWSHIVSDWDIDFFVAELRSIDGVVLCDDHDSDAIAYLGFRDGRTLSVCSPVSYIQERNAALRRVVGTYQKQARLYRTAIADPHQIWPLYPQAIALMTFPIYKPDDILRAAKFRAYLPPGISRHIIHGRAIRVNYPMEALRDTTATLDHKNSALQMWLQQKFANRQIRYYAESTYQFDE